MRRSDFLPSIPGGSLNRPPVPSSRCVFRSHHLTALPMAGLGFGLPAPLPDLSERRKQDLPSSRQNRCHPLEGACQVGRAILETRNGILAVEGRWIFRMHLLFVAVWPDSQLSWCQSTTAPATDQDQGDEGLRTRSPAPGANRRPRKSSSSAG